ncbi:MAG: methyltransferase domain-containing protein [Gammaproteobacteria bacterium]|nr:MAG: methyltransferase domain-containing protein [Gammaproteobacteria bacterium]
MPRRSLAQRADRYALYQKAVQSPDFEVDFFLQRYRELRGGRPLLLREDFCGTALLCAAWCRSSPRRRAYGVDLSAEALAWGRRHHLRGLGRRVRLIQANVLEVAGPPADVACAMNFSYCVFQTRGGLRHYFEVVRRSLKEDGLFFLDLLGGTEAMGVAEEERPIPGEEATYVWEQASFDPVTHAMECHIHFRFPDGSSLRRAFSYRWRLWTLPEVLELLQEAGFARTHLWWEEVAEDPADPEMLRGTGRYVPVTGPMENQESWIAYLVAEA